MDQGYSREVPDTRVAVLVDYQNCYMGARHAIWLGTWTASLSVRSTRGDSGVLLYDRGRAVGPDRHLEYVRVFRKEPSAVHSPKGPSPLCASDSWVTGKHRPQSRR